MNLAVIARGFADVTVAPARPALAHTLVEIFPRHTLRTSNRRRRATRRGDACSGVSGKNSSESMSNPLGRRDWCSASEVRATPPHPFARTSEAQGAPEAYDILVPLFD